MVNIKFQGKDVGLILNMFALREFGGSVNANTPGQAFDKLRAIIGDYEGGIPFDAQDVIASLFYTMHTTYCAIEEKEVQFKKAEAYDVMLDLDAFNGIVSEINNFLPDPVTVKKNEIEAVTE